MKPKIPELLLFVLILTQIGLSSSKKHHLSFSKYVKLAKKLKKGNQSHQMHKMLRKLLLKLGKVRKNSKTHARSLTVPVIELLEACRILLQGEEHLIIEGHDISGGTMNLELPKDPPTIVMNQMPLQHVHYYNPEETLRQMDKQEIPVFLI